MLMTFWAILETSLFKLKLSVATFGATFYDNWATF